jgi:hypothetical protein
MKRIALWCLAVLMVAGIVAFKTSASGHSDEEAARSMESKFPRGTATGS